MGEVSTAAWFGEKVLGGIISAAAGKGVNGIFASLFGSDGSPLQKIEKDFSHIEDQLSELQHTTELILNYEKKISSQISDLKSELETLFEELKIDGEELSASDKISDINTTFSTYSDYVKDATRAPRVFHSESDWDDLVYKNIRDKVKYKLNELQDIITGANTTGTNFLMQYSVFVQNKLGTANDNSPGENVDSLYRSYKVFESYFHLLIITQIKAYALLIVLANYKEAKPEPSRELINAKDQLRSQVKLFREAVYEMVLSQYQTFPDSPSDWNWDLPDGAYSVMGSLAKIEASIEYIVESMKSSPKKGFFYFYVFNQKYNLSDSVSAQLNNSHLTAESHKSYTSKYYHTWTMDKNEKLVDYDDSHIVIQRFTKNFDPQSSEYAGSKPVQDPPQLKSHMESTLNGGINNLIQKTTVGSHGGYFKLPNSNNEHESLYVAVGIRSTPILLNPSDQAKVIKSDSSGDYTSRHLNDMTAKAIDESGSGNKGFVTSSSEESYSLSFPDDFGKGKLKLLFNAKINQSKGIYNAPPYEKGDLIDVGDNYELKSKTNLSNDNGDDLEIASAYDSYSDTVNKLLLIPSNDYNKLNFKIEAKAFVDGHSWDASRNREFVTQLTSTVEYTNISISFGWQKEDPPKINS